MNTPAVISSDQRQRIHEEQDRINREQISKGAQENPIHIARAGIFSSDRRVSSTRMVNEFNSAEPWLEPQPLIGTAASRKYPVDALPGNIGLAVTEVAAFVQCPMALAACSALSSLSVAAQGLANVRRGPDLEGPVSVYTLAVAESGERKSECDRRFGEALREWEASERLKIAPDLARNRADLAAWEQEREAVLQSIRNARKKRKSTDELRDQLEELEANKPRSISVPRLLLESETAENLAWSLRTDGWPSSGLLSSEAGVVFGGHSMRRDSIMQSLALLNKLWSGEPLRVGRRTSESFELVGARLTMGLAVQPETVATFFAESNGLARSTGFAARFLFAWPESTQGTRLYRTGDSTWPGLTAFKARVRTLLDMGLPQERFQLDLDSDALEAWRVFHDRIETDLRVGGELQHLKDVASKAADNCARIAGLFHLFENGPNSRISASRIEQAARIVTWHLHEADRFLGALALPKSVSGAVKLDAWLVATCRQRGCASISTREAMNRGPNSVRHKADLYAALAELAEANRSRLDDDRRTISLNPALVEVPQ